MLMTIDEVGRAPKALDEGIELAGQRCGQRLPVQPAEISRRHDAREGSILGQRKMKTDVDPSGQRRQEQALAGEFGPDCHAADCRQPAVLDQRADRPADARGVDVVVGSVQDCARRHFQPFEPSRPAPIMTSQ